MRNKILSLVLIIAATRTYAVNQREIYSKNGNYRIPQSSEHIIAIERRGYENLLRVVDEQNRQKGINTNYTDKRTNQISRFYDKVDFIAVSDYTEGFQENFSGLKVASTTSDLAYSSTHVGELISRGAAAISKENLEKSSFTRRGSLKRFYFGNGNTVKDISVLTRNKFNSALEKKEEKKEIREKIEGVYEAINTKMNQLDISMEEYYEFIENKSREEISKFLQKKLEKQGISTVQKEDELYTKDSQGKDWKVLWSIEPVSIHQTLETDENKRFKDDIFTRIYTYHDSFDVDKSEGRLVYTKEGNILVEDKYTYKTDIDIKGKGYNEYVSLEKMIEKAKEKAETGEEPDNAIEHYFKDKKIMTEEEFTAKWITPFEKGGEYETALKAMQEEVILVKNKKEKLDRELNELKEKLDLVQKDIDWPNDFWKYRFGNDQEKKEYLEGKSDKVKKLIEEYEKYEPIRSQKSDESLELDSEIQYEIPKKYGFYRFWTMNADDKKWVDRVINNVDIINNILGKNIEFRGKGRIEGTVDFGEGDNSLTIAEQMTGRYGTNIIFGPYSKLKNIKQVKVGGAIGGGSAVSLSGRSSVSLDIDPNVKNEKGNLVQHLLKGSDSDIIFTSTSGSDKNDYYIELMTSRIGEDTGINMGRKIRYQAVDRDTPGKKIDYEMKFISDSIAHNLEDNKKFDEDGNSLLNVTIKDRIKRLNTEENSVYASIKNAKAMGMISDTLTSTNKKTSFSVLDDEREEKKLLNLAKYLKTKSSKELIQDLSQFEVSEVKQQEMIEWIETIKKGETIQKILKKEELLKRKLEQSRKLINNESYQKMDLTNLLKELETFSLENLKENREDEQVRIENTKKLKEVLEKFDIESLELLKTEYPDLNISEVLADINNSKKYTNSNNIDKWDFGWLLDRVGDLISNLKIHLNTEPIKLEEDIAQIDEELAKDLNSYNHNTSKEYQKLKDKLYYTVREEEVLTELKNILTQIKDKNIYSKLNKVAKNEISTYTNLPFDINRSLSKNKNYARGGFISARTVQPNFKGNIYTAYGLYEKELEEKNRIGFIIGGSNTDHREVYSRTINTVATESSIKGVSAYIGTYWNKPIMDKLDWINGVGLQYGNYNVSRQVRNNYQNLESKGKSKIGALNTYSGFVYHYPIQEDVEVLLKGILSYSYVSQNKIIESRDLALEIKNKDYHYLDGEVGIALSKTLYDFKVKSNLTAGIYSVVGLTGYNNKNLSAKVKDSSSSFQITGDKFKRDATKLFIDYNVQMETGLNYGLEGTYISNQEQSNVKIGFKAGYTF